MSARESESIVSIDINDGYRWLFLNNPHLERLLALC